MSVFSSSNCEQPQLSISNVEPISHIWHGFSAYQCALLKSQRRDQQDYIKAKLVAGTPLQLTNRLLVWRAVFLPDQSVRQCGYCCSLTPGLWLWVPFWAFPPAAPQGAMEPLIYKRYSKWAEEFKAEGYSLWLVQPSALLGECFEVEQILNILNFCLVINGHTSQVWLILILQNKSQTSLCGALRQ